MCFQNQKKKEKKLNGANSNTIVALLLIRANIVKTPCFMVKQ